MKLWSVLIDEKEMYEIYHNLVLTINTGVMISIIISIIITIILSYCR